MQDRRIRNLAIDEQVIPNKKLHFRFDDTRCMCVIQSLNVLGISWFGKIDRGPAVMNLERVELRNIRTDCDVTKRAVTKCAGVNIRIKQH